MKTWTSGTIYQDGRSFTLTNESGTIESGTPARAYNTALTASQEGFGTMVFELSGGTIMDDGTISEFSVTRVLVAPECSECWTATSNVAGVSTRHGESRLEVLCTGCARGTQMTRASLADMLKVPVEASEDLRVGAQLALIETQELLEGAATLIAGEQAARVLGDEDARVAWGFDVMTGGAEEFIKLLMVLEMLDLETIEQRKDEIKHLLGFADPSHVEAMIKASPASEQLKLIAELV